MASDALAPDFIQYLFSTKPKFDCYFEVGNKSQGIPERIGAVKLMLMAHSEVFRLQLEESDLAEKGDVPVVDVHPGTFKEMLMYVYGHDTTSDLCFDEADNLLYVAEKYMIKSLKDRLAVRLMKLLNTENICSLLNNPACYTHLELGSAITKILRFETDRVLGCSQFLWVNADGFLKILEQDGLAVTEIELWRAAIKWAKHRANSEDGQLLRQEIAGFTRHLRLCTLTGDEICEVIPSGVLSNEEIGTVCVAIRNKEQPQCLNEFSNEIEPRKRLHNMGYEQNEFSMAMSTNHFSSASDVEYNLTILTKQHSVELMPLVCESQDRNSMDPENWTYKVDCITSITKVANPLDPDDSSEGDATITVTFSDRVKYGVQFEIPLAVDGRNINLTPDTKYIVKIKINGIHKRYYRKDTGINGNKHLIVSISSTSYGSTWYYNFPSAKFRYRVTTLDNR